MGYNFFEDNNSGYIRHKHLHGGGDFGIGIEYASYIENKWAQLKSKIKEIYHIIPPKKFILFEYKILFKNLSNRNKIA